MTAEQGGIDVWRVTFDACRLLSTASAQPKTSSGLLAFFGEQKLPINDWAKARGVGLLKRLTLIYANAHMHQSNPMIQSIDPTLHYPVRKTFFSVKGCLMRCVLVQEWVQDVGFACRRDRKRRYPSSGFESNERKGTGREWTVVCSWLLD
jgi:hypothetical protein